MNHYSFYAGLANILEADVCRNILQIMEFFIFRCVNSSKKLLTKMTKVKINTHKSKSRKKSVIIEATPKNQQNTTILEEEEDINSGFSSYLRSGEGIISFTLL